jgi:hypothetical protein
MTFGRMWGQSSKFVGAGLVIVGLGVFPAVPASAQDGPPGTKVTKLQKRAAAAAQSQQFGGDQPDANNVKNEFENLLRRYPPTVLGVFREDPTLLDSEQYLATYPPLASFLSAHPEIASNPAFYLDGLAGDVERQMMNRYGRGDNMWGELMKDLEIFAGFGIAIGLLTWLIRTFLDYRRWNRLSKVQTEVHTRLLDRFSSNEELMAYIATPAGSKFLQSAPISLDTGTRSMGAPLNRIMWSLQAGLVLCAGGCGLMLASGRMTDDSYLPLEIMGILAVALGVGFAVSAAVSFLMSQKMGLLEPASQKRQPESPEVQ